MYGVHDNAHTYNVHTHKRKYVHKHDDTNAHNTAAIMNVNHIS